MAQALGPGARRLQLGRDVLQPQRHGDDPAEPCVQRPLEHLLAGVLGQQHQGGVGEALRQVAGHVERRQRPHAAVEQHCVDLGQLEGGVERHRVGHGLGQHERARFGGQVRQLLRQGLLRRGQDDRDHCAPPELGAGA